MAGAGDILGTAAKLQHAYRLGDQVGSARADDVNADQAVGSGIGNHLDEALHFIQTARPRVGGEGEFADANVPAALAGLFLGQTNGGNLGRGVNDTGDGVVVHVGFLAGEAFGEGNALFLGFMGEHGAGDQVANGEDAGHVGLEILVDTNLSGAFLDGNP